MVKIYNSLTNKKEEFTPIEEGKVTMYCCGPTVYNYIHIGNARPPIVYDMVRRYLAFRGYDVQFVSNFTDVDDKIIRAAQELGEEVFEVAERFIEAYHSDTAALNVTQADLHPKVTETMDDIIDFIVKLEQKGFAYESGGDVYFRTRKFDGYGKLSGQSLDDLRSGARIDVDDRKEDAVDFVLWKAAKPNEIAWKSPWGQGRPGWHIECSAMIKKNMGDTIDIHAGGKDLAFPHHENEIAQSEALTGRKLANYWMHNGFVNINNEKMSKSLGNFVLAHDIIQQYPPEVVRFFMLMAHYRTPINFSDELLVGAQAGLDRIKNAVANLSHRLGETADLGDSEGWLEKVNQYKERFIEEMDDDFNSANGISVMFDLAKEANVYLRETQTSKQVLQAFIELFDEVGTVLGVDFHEEKALLDEDIDQLIEERNTARKERNFARADEIRELLKEQNIILEDTAQGVRWKRG
ncbi:cysteinyl-tRNA synthetase [Alkalihalobacillus xiaoxiensis]|uniref:Cysteine--tRNA ligase n=1 Tax=Shouchella xiaoxiensis TaxID=766895 RepID=A0ABS2SZH7_9BACI|nr:cysteine--tRNA ligase [Shouchella xiaoxiensis]MBM7840923.1 cysteinyl-tRNA synthetase [Shouchella xiaoxiensis]